MKTTLGAALVMLLAFAGERIVAAPCFELESDEARLACYDATRVCTGISDALERLHCFDRAYGKWQANPQPADGPEDRSAALAAEPAPGPDETVNPAVPKDADDFGKREPPPEPAYIEARILEVQTGPDYIDYLRLDNGQVWRETRDARVSFEVGQQVRIEEGVLNSFDLRLDGVRKLIKVRRID